MPPLPSMRPMSRLVAESGVEALPRFAVVDRHCFFASSAMAARYATGLLAGL